MVKLTIQGRKLKKEFKSKEEAMKFLREIEKKYSIKKINADTYGIYFDFGDDEELIDIAIIEENKKKRS